MATKRDIFKEHLSSYLKAGKLEKSKILKAVCLIAGYHQKAAIRKFRRLQMQDASRTDQRGRKEYYTSDVTVALKDLWEIGNEVCGELLHPMIAEYVTVLKRDRMWQHNPETTNKLLAMSRATCKRRVGRFKKVNRGRKGLSDTKPSHIKHLVPIFMGPWTDKPPGFGQIDTVRHSNSASGDAVYTLNYTDSATMTVIARAQWNKGMQATRNSMQVVKQRLPFSWLGAHPDTGSEFLNQFVMSWCKEENIELSRSRPNHKNDNMYVEERNGHVIRKTVGYLTLNCSEAVDALNALYDVLTPYLIHFVAVRRMLAKERLQSRHKRTYEKIPKTPYQRILGHEAVTKEVRDKLQREHEQLNPLLLKQEIDRRLRKLYDVQRKFGNPSARSGLR